MINTIKRKLFPRQWIMLAHGGIEVSRILPGTWWSRPLYEWAVFRQTRTANGHCHPIRTFGQTPIAQGFTWGSYGEAEYAASVTLSNMVHA